LQRLRRLHRLRVFVECNQSPLCRQGRQDEATVTAATESAIDIGLIGRDVQSLDGLIQ